MTKTKTKLQRTLADSLEKMLADRDGVIEELAQVSVALNNTPKQNKWIATQIARIEELDKYIRQHQNRIEGIEQRQKLSQASVERKRDTKRKILLGALVEQWVKTGTLEQSKFIKELDKFLVRDSDRELFSDLLANEEQAHD